jgi:hypothetical protein
MIELGSKMEGVKLRSSKVKAMHKESGTYEPKEEKRKTETPVVKAVGSKVNPQFSKLTDIIAGDSMHFINYQIPKGLELFPMDWKMRLVDLFYPYAKGGPLYIDFPVGPAEIEKCKEKRIALNKLGARYVFILGQDTEGDIRFRLETGA